MNEEKVREIFAKVRKELYFPPCELEILKDGEKSKETPFFVVNSKVYISLNSIPSNVDEEKYLESVIRHEISHLHYCPYDIKTAHELLKSAYDSCRDWKIAYFSLLLFSDLNVDCFYLRKRFNEIPYHVSTFIKSRQKGTKELIQASYQYLLKQKPKHDYTINNVAIQVKAVMKSERNWFSKVRLISKILAKYNLRIEIPRNKLLSSGFYIPLREDLEQDTIEKITERLGGVKNKEEAKAFYEYWIYPRLDKDEVEKIKKGFGKREKKEERKEAKVGGKEKEREREAVKPSIDVGKEPSLPTSMGKQYDKLPENVLDEILWKVFWYKARAKRTMLMYFEEGRRQEPNLSIFKYPMDWNIEDEVDELDVEASLDEGKLRIEINTLKWESEAKERGVNLTLRNVPSMLVVLDSSKSMEKIFDDAAVAAFISLLTARKVGSRASTVTFSTNYYVSDWNSLDIEKELTLALYFGEMTILPLNAIKDLIRNEENRVLVNIITDCGWQNIEEALPALEEISNMGHKVAIFHLRGGEYKENIERISKTGKVNIVFVKDPERDLQSLVVREAARDYGKALISLRNNL